ncbi:MAG: hypothetical protein MJ101_03805 [Clostridia bacterium]|nr:hypothetical protein [Clostridia bacterium]
MKRKTIKRLISLSLVVLTVVCLSVGVCGADENTGDGNTVITNGMPEDNVAKTLWSQFWDSLFGAFSGTNARDSVVTVCSILAAVVAVLLKNVIGKVSDGINGFTASNGTKINELIAGVNENASEILELSERIRSQQLEAEKVKAGESEKNEMIRQTNDAVLALADMLMTTYNSSSTIPEAAKEVIRTKYLGVVKATEASKSSDTATQ